ncbi:MAG: hypothetical protein C5S49_04390 [Candidatus Methanogaster sp.]|nr:MAG: hypothetical protein C5S49_04390 [ANME-2 cluster archaeon]
MVVKWLVRFLVIKKIQHGVRGLLLTIPLFKVPLKDIIFL